MHRHRMAMATSASDHLKSIISRSTLLEIHCRSCSHAQNSECRTANPPSGHLAAKICQPYDNHQSLQRQHVYLQHSNILGPPLPSSHSFEDGPRSIDVQLAGEILDQGCQDDLLMGSLTKYSNSHSSHILQQFLYFHDAPCTNGPKYII